MNQIGLAPFLTLVFVVLKLTHQLSWDWVWILSPAWIGMIVILLLTIIYKTFSFFFRKN